MVDLSSEFLNGVGVVAVVLFVFVALVRGSLVTRREADAYRERAEKAENALDQALRQNTDLMEMARLGSATFEALRKNATENQP